MTTTSTAQFSLGGKTPTHVATPATAADVAELLAMAADQRQAVVPWGGGTQQGLGRPPKRYDTALSLVRLERVVEYAPADMTAQVEAGITLAELQRVLARQGQYVALESPFPDRATLGGLLAADGAIGPRRAGYGERRDQVIGIGMAHPDGTLTKAGGSVVKNVTGYDMAKLYVGSLGTLGVITDVTLRLRPFPPSTRTVVARFTGRGPALQAASLVRRPPLQPTALTLLSRDPSGASDATWTLAAEFAGGGSAVTRQVKEATDHAAKLGGDAGTLEGDDAAAFWVNVRDFGRAPETSQLILRAMALPSRLGDVLDAMAETTALAGLPPASVIAHAANGIVYAYWENPAGTAWSGAIASMRERIGHFRGTVVVEQAHPEFVEVYDPWGAPPESFPIMQAFKREFDPHSVLNPGRFVGGL